MNTHSMCAGRPAPKFEITLRESLHETVTFQLLQALRASDADVARWQSWQVTDCQIARLDDWRGLQFHAKGMSGRPWLQVFLQPETGHCRCRLGTVRRGRFHVMAESRYVPLTRLNAACDAWGRAGVSNCQEVRHDSN